MVLLIIIYLAFISLGLPDSLLGSSWPVMYEGFGVPISSAGIISMIVTAGTIISSLFSDRVISRFGTGRVTVVSVFMTAAALMGISFTGNFAVICIWAVPLGLGAGSVDAGLNGFVAKHYEAKHMNWLHAFWGLGASAGPLIMSFCLLNLNSWNAGYRTVGIIQLCLTAALLLSLPLWKRAGDTNDLPRGERKPAGFSALAKLPGAKQALLAFFCYCAIESIVGLWGSSYLVKARGIAPETAASWISLYYFGIMSGRLLSGFLAIKLSQKRMIATGLFVIALGITILILPFKGAELLAGLFLIGLGCAPVFPGMIHETPNNFGEKYAQSLIGMQMASAYVGAAFIPPIFGVLGEKLGYGLLPYCAAVLLVLMAVMIKSLFSKAKGRQEI